jgi:hypothetical protein
MINRHNFHFPALSRNKHGYKRTIKLKKKFDSNVKTINFQQTSLIMIHSLFYYIFKTYQRNISMNKNCEFFDNQNPYNKIIFSVLKTFY